MKSIVHFIFFFIILVQLNSCLTTMQPLVTDENIITDDRVTGTWIDSGREITVQKFFNSKFYQSVKSDMRLSVADSLFLMKYYIANYTQSDLEYWWAFGLMRINKQVYLNLFALKCTDNENNEVYFPYGGRALETYSIAKLEWKGNDLISVHFLNGDWIKKMILAGNIRIKYEYDPLFGSFAITASSEELEQFLQKYGNDKRIYSDEYTRTITRKDKLYVTKNN
ncbi:MAG TPA: hypothetical protein VFW07_12675 [Parafilimonas sp.]|nr:hypothetical protein [Parafilimonas sp.]